MKNPIHVVFLVLALGFSSCQQDGISPFSAAGGGGVSVSASELPASITNYLAENYAGVEIVRARKSKKRYEVYLDNGLKLKFSLNGDLREIEQEFENEAGGNHVAASSLPAAVMTYINTNFPGTTVTKAERYPTHYEIVLSNLTKLKFSLTGQFLENESEQEDGDHVAVSSLPKAITDYVNKNYAGASITKAEKKATYYEIKLSNGVKLKFTLNGAFLEKDDD